MIDMLNYLLDNPSVAQNIEYGVAGLAVTLLAVSAIIIKKGV